MQVQFTRRPDSGTVAEFTRLDGVRVRVNSYDRTGQVPHDAAHLVIERAFGLTHGFWGCVGEGALFATVEIVEGRPKHDHRARSIALIKAHAEELRLTERVVGTVLFGLDGQTRHLSRDLAATWSLTRFPPPADPETAATKALADLSELQHRWTGLRPVGTFDLEWPRPRPARRH